MTCQFRSLMLQEKYVALGLLLVVVRRFSFGAEVSNVKNLTLLVASCKVTNYFRSEIRRDIVDTDLITS